jgi:hypothetical protein
MLTSGQQVYTQNGRLSPVYQLDDFSWQRAVASGVQPGLEAFANAKPVETVITRPSQTVVRTQPNRDGDRVTIRFEARMYNTTYHRGVDGGIPYDAYYFPIILLDQTQATQNGEKLWGRFVRSPSHDYRDQSSVQWWFVTWDVQDGPVWVQQERKIASPQLGP